MNGSATSFKNLRGDSSGTGGRQKEKKQAKTKGTTQNRLKNDRKRLEIDSLGGGSAVVGDESGGWAVAEKQCH